VIAADHGEAFLEHGREGHAQDLHEEVTHVPLIILPPFLLEPGIRVRETVSNADVWPTLLELVGLPALPNADGRSLVPLVLAASGGHAPGPDAVAERARPVFAQLVRGWGRPKRKDSASLVSVTDGSQRLIATLGASAPGELYDRAADRREQHDRATPDPGTAVRLRALIDDYADDRSTPWGFAPREVELDELRLNHLRALGYVVDR
jgi:arylsulfatase A-like enzyme